ncbi:hypothetical protein RO3G_00598 [Rhizopus delemar RA 99-880]|uniref:Uncharacterized protein n=1 Tax=Rhizopus delemar (strain RA 99-880 / ATCC MYA-4621 / FGSC 9543 / NRRL 43880) TaxID=246409 RepID=I1BI64_RHIO9|nr:hypothetical protein RO3G_00598 [Rhizopus delemar RA 99-880]|eukprot:EIE75894.1 hypothetical protein RO3G_00598 [Rhizopus delemar RA 99-880]
MIPNDIVSQEDPCVAIDALTNAQKDHVVSKEGVSTLTVPITHPVETNIESDSEDSGDSDYVPLNESEKDSDESQDESATDNMSIDSQEVNDLQNEAGKSQHLHWRIRNISLMSDRHLMIMTAVSTRHNEYE